MIDCYSCNGSTLHHFGESYGDCPECEGTGEQACSNCGEDPARVELRWLSRYGNQTDALCTKCALLAA